MRIVLDANVLLAGFGAHGLCEALIAVILESHQLVSSQHLLTETRRYLTTKFKVPAAQADEIIAFLRDRAEMVKPAAIPASQCRDPDDLPVLGTAVAGRAGLLVTGDKDMLVLKEHAGIPIVTPRECYERLRWPYREVGGHLPGLGYRRPGQAGCGVSLTVERTFHLGSRAGRKGGCRRVVQEGPEPEPLPIEPTPGRTPRISRLMALAIRCDQLLRSGSVADASTLADLAHVTQPRMTQILNLTLLAPDIQEALLCLPPVVEGRPEISEKGLRRVCAEVDWERQRTLVCDAI